MSRKTLLILIGIIIAIGATILFLFLKKGPSTTEQIPGETTCLVFQSIDQSQPCFREEVPSVSVPSTPVISVSTSPSSIVTSAASSSADVACESSPTAFEKNDCISSVAQSKKDPTICDAVIGSLAQEACRRDATKTTATTASVPAPSPTYQAFVEQYFASTVKPKPVATVQGKNEPEPVVAASTVEQTVKYGLSYGAPLAVYSASRYQVAPSASIKIYGSGFATANNILNIGTVQTTLGSADGSTLEATAPGLVGEYEIWVTNDKGSSRVSTRPVKITVTNSPAPVPVIDSATPSSVPVDGTVVLSGSGFGSSNNVFTSLGTLMNVPSDGHTISISISSLPYISYAKASPALKGRVSPVLVNIQTNSGASEKLFQFNVQF